MIRDRVDDVAATGHDGVDPNVVLFLKFLPDGVDGCEPLGCGIQRIDTLMRACGMAGKSRVMDDFADKTVARTVHPDVLILFAAGAVAEDGDVDIVENTAGNELGLAAVIADFPRLAKLFPVGKLNELLCRDCDESQFSAELIFDFRPQQPIGGSQHGGRLHVMGTGVDIALFIAVGVIEDDEGVEFAHDAKVWARASGVIDGDTARNVKFLDVKAKVAQLICDKSAANVFAVSGLRVLP
ncbi:hypothetical protein SDC9_96605 [bioreactor metagenome]|uniref:Uncharacterized protein n=1 Tax=bioreactor metagenome TaxID=1076179 RepID=A0A645AC69_9ZZZZ